MKAFLKNVCISLKEETGRWAIGVVFTTLLGLLTYFRDLLWDSFSAWAAANPLANMFLALASITVTASGCAIFWWMECFRSTRKDTNAGSPKGWKGRYESVPNSSNTTLFRLKEQFANIEGQHLICPVCYYNDKMALLLRTKHDSELACSQCRTTFSSRGIPSRGAFETSKLLEETLAEKESLKLKLNKYEPEDLVPFEENLIKELALEPQGFLMDDEWSSKYSLPFHRWRHHIDRLIAKNYIVDRPREPDRTSYALHPKGRDLAIAREFI